MARGTRGTGYVHFPEEVRTRRRLGPVTLRHPAQFVVAAFATAILAGTVLLSLPFATEGPGSAPFLVALFTATSSVCVTGLIVVDTPSYWSTFGEGSIMFLIQIGGFGIMALASLLALFVYRNLGVRGRVVAQAETKTIELGDVRRVLISVAIFSIAFEIINSAILTGRLLSYKESLGRAAYLGAFHSVSAFNNAGFSLYPDSLERFVSDPWIILPIALAFIIGGIGFPVLLELRRSLRSPSRWSLHTKLTLVMTAALIPLGMAMVIFFEWNNSGTMGPLSAPAKVLSGFFHSVTPRTAGFNSLPVGEMNESTWLGTIVLMFIGGGSAGTAGGVKVTTIAIVAAMVWAEARGEPNVDIMMRRLPGPAQRQALSIVVAGIVAAMAAAIWLMAVSGLTSGDALFEAFSAFGTVGLSTGVTPDLSPSGRILIIGLMFAGRVGPITLGAALALREHRRLYRYPEERPIVG
jgi:trk system potassium uptake protein